MTREIENKLSDALHERLTERFVDRRTSVLMRRLRENSVLNTEIGKTGEVIVEGHVIGRLDGFTFAPDAAEAGSDAKALQATALKALAGEIDARAEKLAAAPDEQFVLTSDGTIRWTGDAVARLVAADDALHPRLRIISDERLAGAPREAVQTRLDLWLKTHIEKLLGPLFDLHKAEDITGIARGIAFQLIEALGVLERQKIAAEMKDLDQPSRATLRKYGVRFGAYHIYVPALLKPAARALASLLWAEKQSNVDMSALSGAQHLAGSGRTSFPVDKSLDRDAYRVLGYRQCGERAVRVDILERLADLIRPALSWREASPGTKPAGAFDGRGFVVTQAMTSLTGSAGEDFASILRALGYRMEKKPPLPPKPVAVEAAAADAAAAEAVSETSPRRRPTALRPPRISDADDACRQPCRATLHARRRRSRRARRGRAGATGCGRSRIRPNRSAAGTCRGGRSRAADQLPLSEAAAPKPPTGAVEEAAAAEAPQEQCRSRSRDRDRCRCRRSPTRTQPRQPRPKSPQRRKWSRSGGPAAVRKSAGRVTIATVSAITTVRRRARSPRLPLSPGEAGDAAKGERHRRGRRDRNPDFRKPRTDAPPVEGADGRRRRRWRAGQPAARGPRRPAAARAF